MTAKPTETTWAPSTQQPSVTAGPEAATQTNWPAGAPQDPHNVVAPYQPQHIPATYPMAAQVPSGFHFDGGPIDYLVVDILATLLTVCTLGFGLPWAICMRHRWKAEHTTLDGRRLRFTGTGTHLAAWWLKAWLLTVITLGIYSFWVVPRLRKFEVEHQAFA